MAGASVAGACVAGASVAGAWVGAGVAAGAQATRINASIASTAIRLNFDLLDILFVLSINGLLPLQKNSVVSLFRWMPVPSSFVMNCRSQSLITLRESREKKAQISGT